MIQHERAARAVAAAQSAQLRSEREAEEAELEEAVARREREALQRVEAAKAALVERSLVLAESRADFSAASSPRPRPPPSRSTRPSRARSAVESAPLVLFFCRCRLVETGRVF